MEIFGVKSDGDKFFVETASGIIHICGPRGGPLPLLPGWAPVVALKQAEALCILGLRRDGGEVAAWFLDQNYRFLTNDANDLSKVAREELRRAVQSGMGRVWELVSAVNVRLDNMVSHLFRYVGTVIDLGADTIGPQIIPARKVVLLVDGKAADAGAFLIENANGKPVVASIIHGIFARDFLADMVSAMATGRLTLPSPFDGEPVSSDVALPLTPSAIAYKFHDSKNGVVFFAFHAHARAFVTALYFPNSGLLLVPHQRALDDLVGSLGGILPDFALLRHASEHAVELDTYLASDARKFVILFMHEHLGHHLYNELGGLDYVVNALPRTVLPNILIINADKSEMYGPVDVIFPEFADKIDRTPHNPFSLAAHAYRNLLSPIRPADDYVPRGLAKRIIKHLESDSDMELCRHHHSILSEHGFSVVMLGLRVENRTLVDPVDFFCQAIDVLIERLGKVAIVVDGHDAASPGAGGRLFESHGERIAVRSVLEAENEIVAAIRMRYAGRTSVEIISTVGATMAVTVFWCQRSAFFITPWGAGLAKYRWLCNRPGLVAGGKRFLGNPADLPNYLTTHLYAAREFMQTPTPVVFFSADEVEDDPSAPLLIGLNDSARVNYRVKPEAVRERVLQTLAILPDVLVGKPKFQRSAAN